MARNVRGALTVVADDDPHAKEEVELVHHRAHSVGQRDS
jgi:hypothetical protein